jgi:uncharacterized protein (TIGR03083 family)
MEKARYIAALRADSAALAEAARLGLDEPVPSCPGWSVADLVQHTGRVHRAVTRRVRNLDLERRSSSDIPLPPRPELVNWFEDGAEALGPVLEAAQPDASVWNWSIRPKVASFWWRRMAQETAVHRWDAESAHARQQPIAADVAVDGVDEFLDVFLPTDLAEKPTTDLIGTVQLQCSDRPASWLVTVSGGVLLARPNQEPTASDRPLATVSAPASDLLLLLWRRGEPTRTGLETGGDAALLARFAALADLD